MKKLIILLFFTLSAIISCTEDSQITEDNSTVDLKYLDEFKEKEASNFNQIEELSKRFDEIKLKQKSNLQRSVCNEIVYVPDNYSTIQDAILAVCENGIVYVKSGVYQESPGIFTPGILIKAIGDVTLKGGFGMAADNIRIHSFKIDNAYSEWSKVGIGSAPGFNGFDLRHNTIYSTMNLNTPDLFYGHIGIYLEYCDNATIQHNSISGNMEVGIYIDAIRLDSPDNPPHPYGSSNNNIISNNVIKDIIGELYVGTCIQLRGDTDNTMVQGNYVDTSNGWGISLWSFKEWGKQCNGNILKNNIAKNNFYAGLEIGNGGSDNIIGPNNESRYNDVGIFLRNGSSSNLVYKNTFLNNTICDILNYDWPENTFKNNKTGCASGVD